MEGPVGCCPSQKQRELAKADSGMENGTDVTTKTQPRQRETLQVREKLRLVIPHPKHVEEFLGRSDFECKGIGPVT